MRPKMNDTAVVLSGPALQLGLQLRFQDGWWNVTADERLNISLETPHRRLNATLSQDESGVDRVWLRGRRMQVHRTSVRTVRETVYDLDMGHLDPWGMLVIRIDDSNNDRVSERESESESPSE